MNTSEIKITFQPSGRSVFVLPGTKVLEAAACAGIILNTPCGGQGTCGKCRIRVVSGTAGKERESIAHLPARLATKGYRLACQTRLEGPGPVVIDVPEDSMFEAGQRILTGDTGEKAAFNPVVRKRKFQLAAPTSEDARSDLTRFRDAVGPVTLPASLLYSLPAFLRANSWGGTAVLADHELIALEPGDTTASALGVAFDIGTTTVVGTLFDLASGRELGVESRMNGQIPYGDDVVSRIRRVREDSTALRQLQEAVLETANGLIARLIEKAGARSETIYEIAIAGNSTMQQILCGCDPSALGEVPFVHLFDEAQVFDAARVGFTANHGAKLFVFPQIGGFVGGDTVAGMLAARLDRWGKPVLLVDIGTNGEIVLAHGGEMLATSTAAGPAFEGARIRQGMRATSGAIEKVIVRNDVQCNVIGNVRPVGICGTALIDAVAALLRLGIVESTGRLLDADELPASVPESIRRRLITDNGDSRFLLATGEQTATGDPICLWQRDIRELQLAAGAIRAGINILLRQVGLLPEDLGAVLLAGAFGNFIRRSNARRIGLLPQIPCERIRFIGNAASMGAKLALLSADEREYAARLRRTARRIDLSMDRDFQSEFSAAMIFPESDLNPCDADHHES